MNSKRGQFYLMAAIIIVGLLIAVVTITNFAITKESPDEIKIYQLSQDLKLEGEQVINFGIISQQEINNVLTTFTKEYGAYISNKENDVYFIYGDKKGINVIGYTLEDLGGIGLDFGGNKITFDIVGETVSTKNFDFSKLEDLQTLFGCDITPSSGGSKSLSDISCDELAKDGTLTETNIIVDVANTKYPFQVKEGENFFFVVQQSRTTNEINL